MKVTLTLALLVFSWNVAAAQDVAEQFVGVWNWL